MLVCTRITALLLAASAVLAPAHRAGAWTGDDRLLVLEPLAVYGDIGRLDLGEPLAVAIDFDGNAIVADGSPGRIVMFDPTGRRSLEFEQPLGNPGFFPTDITLYGFFTYAVDERQRTLVRFDNDGTYRDVLLDFNKLTGTRRVSPYGIGTDAQGRIAITDIENHQVLLLDSFLRIDILFGNFGSWPGQLDTPLGVSFTAKGDIVVADSGNKRIQYFTDAGEPERVVPDGDGDNPLSLPRRAVVADDGTVYVADPEAGGVFSFDPGGRFLRQIVPEESAQFQPTDVEIHRNGKLYVTDALSRVLYVFQVM
ncbi:MAG: NHL repeat-containing protein [Candidatus Latescibacterota bacterium]|jgi:sugar lactone lactonase YvrE